MAVEQPGNDGRRSNVVAGFKTAEDYLYEHPYFGCTVGRYANRIAGGKFTLDGRNYRLPVNNGPNHLHGGLNAFHRKTWETEQVSADSITFTLMSPDGDEGYPGNLFVSVTYTLTNDDTLAIAYRASTDKPTIINLTNHSYFNLSGFETPLIHDHLLQVNADSFTVKNADNVPTGEIRNVGDSPLDFRGFKPIGRNIAELVSDMGYDHNFVLNKRDVHSIPAATLIDPGSGRQLTVYTDCPGIQVYSANWWDGRITGSQGKQYLKHCAVALETQSFPDSPNHPNFPGVVLRPGEEWSRFTNFHFSTSREQAG